MRTEIPEPGGEVPPDSDWTSWQSRPGDDTPIRSPFRAADGRTRRVIYRVICALPMLMAIAITIHFWMWYMGILSNVVITATVIKLGLAVGCGVFSVLPRLRPRVLALGMFFGVALNNLSSLIVEIFTGRTWMFLSISSDYWLNSYFVISIFTSCGTLVVAWRLMRLEIEREWRRKHTPEVLRSFPIPDFDSGSRWTLLSWWAIFLLPLVVVVVMALTNLVQILGSIDQIRWPAFFKAVLVVASVVGFVVWAVRSGRPHWRLLLYGVLVQESLDRLLTWVPELVDMDRPRVGGTFLWTGWPDPFFIATTVWYGLMSVGMVVSIVLAWQRLFADFVQLQLIPSGLEAEEDLAAPGWDEGAGKKWN